MLPEGLIQFLCIFLSFVVGTLYAGKAMRKCIDLGLMGEINNRSSHKTPTPRGGGYYIPILTSIFSLIWLHLGEETHLQVFLVTLTLAGLFIAYLGWLDDNYTFSAKLRLICQISATGLCVFVLPPVFQGIMPLYAEKIILILAWVWFINLYNFMDGIDGIAAVQAGFIAFTLSLFLPEISPILLVLMGSTLGILRFNWHPARVFMGDVGSTYLGFILAGFMIYSLTLNLEANFWASLCISSVFIADTTFTLIKRTLKGKAPWQAHKEHFYQRATQLGMTHAQVVKRVILLNSLFAFLTLFALIQPSLGVYIFMFILAICAMVALRIKYLERSL